MSLLTRLPFVLLVQEIFAWLPLGSAVRIMQAGHFKDFSVAEFFAYVQTLKNSIIRDFEAVFQFGVSVPPLSFRHRPTIFFDPWHRDTAPEWLDARGRVVYPSATDLAHTRLWVAARRLVGVTGQQAGDFEHFLQQDANVTNPDPISTDA